MIVRVISGGMFTDKTKLIVRTLEHAEECGTSLVAIKHSSDDRYTDKAELCSHDDEKYPCMMCSTFFQLKGLILEHVGKGPFHIDEFNFFTGNAKKFFQELRNEDIELNIYGLDLDTNGDTWPAMDAAHAYADYITKLFKGRDIKKYTQKLKSTGNKKDVGGAELYKLVNARDWIPMK